MRLFRSRVQDCLGGRRSKMATRILSRMGFSGHELNDGYTGWKESGR